MMFQGLIFTSRKAGNMTPEKGEFARSNEQGKKLEGLSLAQSISEIKPTALVGATAKRGVFSQKVMEALCRVR